MRTIVRKLICSSFLGSAILAAPASAQTAQTPPQAPAHPPGFVQDSQLNLLLRNLYWNHDRKNGLPDNREWGQALRLAFQSGYTPGPVGVGVDLNAYGVVRLGGDSAHVGRAGVLVPDGHGGVHDESSTAEGAFKLKGFASELRYGNNLRPYNPVFAPADTRLLPASATGLWLTSQPRQDLFLEAGRMTKARDFNQVSHDGRFYASYAGVSTDQVLFLGGRHDLDASTRFSAYGSEFRDIWKQLYLAAGHGWKMPGDDTLNLDLSAYRSLDSGAKRAGDIDVTAWGLTLSYVADAHTFKVARQQVHGDQPLDYLGMGPGTYHDSIYLPNSSQLADFNGPHEKSWGFFYVLDLGKLDLARIPGASMQLRYVRGSGADGNHLDRTSPYAYYANGEKHWESDVDLRYVVQSGSARNLSMRLRYAVHRMTQGTSGASSNQFRLIFEYPLSIL
ncbi:outer membrane porin, OprD family [Streptomyces cavourensis]|nr:outer membrane porin, OprD family [Streptomyces cavourensis]